MKNRLSLVVSLVTLLIATTPAPAKDVKFPGKGGALFSISIPDAWAPKFDDEGTLEAEDKEGHAYLAIWEEDTATELSKVTDDIDELLKEYTTNVKIDGPPQQLPLSGLSALVFKGTAKEKEKGQAIGFEAVVLVVDKDSAAIIFLAYALDSPAPVVQGLIKVLESIKPAK